MSEEITYWNLSLRRFFRYPFIFFISLGWGHLRDEKGKETFLSALPLNLPEGAFYG
jgi:hypothetical protein